MIHSSSSFMTDAFAVETRNAAILRDAAMPDAPLAMPEQVIEVSRPKVSHAPVSRLSRLRSFLAQGFGRTARGR